MAQDSIQQILRPEKINAKQEALPSSTPAAEGTVQGGTMPHFPAWPHSQRGPRSTPPPVGMKPMNAIRREQVVEPGLGQEVAEPVAQGSVPAVNDETEKELAALQETLKKRHARL